MRRALPVLAMLLLVIAAFPARAAEIVLYNGALGTLPAAQGQFFYFTDPSPPGGTSQTASGGVTILDSSGAITDKAGYSAYNCTTRPLPFLPCPLPSLDRTTGFTLRFTVQLTDEQHNNNNRAGFSVIMLANDLQGVELGFWENEIWAQNDGAALFTHGEGIAADTTITRTYDLTIQGDSYTLSSDGPLLSGALRDYSVEGAPYNIPNFVFLGDDTTSAAAVVRIAYVALISPPPAPPAATATATSTLPAGTPGPTAPPLRLPLINAGT